MYFGVNMKRLRESLDMTQAQLAETVGVARSMICRIETGTKVASLMLAKQIADALGCTLDKLFETPAPEEAR